MGVGLKGLLGTLTVVTASMGLTGLFTNVAIAQEENDTPQFETLPQVFEDTFFRNDRNFYRNRQTPRNGTWFLGPFPENEIASDGRAINRLYREVLEQQVSTGPLMRTPDLPTPYGTSLLTNPNVGVSRGQTTIEPSFMPSAMPPVPVQPASPPAQRTPIPALW